MVSGNGTKLKNILKTWESVGIRISKGVLNFYFCDSFNDRFGVIISVHCRKPVCLRANSGEWRENLTHFRVSSMSHYSA